MEQLYMNPATGSIDTYLGWNYRDKSGVMVNAVSRGEVVPVFWDDEEQYFKEGYDPTLRKIL